MKNIHIIPTDKPSRLHLIEDFLMITNEYKNSACDTEANIYITSDEVIRDDDWVYCPVLKKPVFICLDSILMFKNLDYDSNGNSKYKKEWLKKIILTTDPDLIKDGVQAIDDEFLEWFVKNPSCEEVEVNHFGMCCSNQLIAQCINCNQYNPVYKIIIPKEEPEQETVGGQFHKTADMVISVIRNKETPEEAAKSKYGIGYGAVDSINAFIEGTKWQAERMYSEEEVFNLCREFAIFVQRNGPSYKKQQEWFEQFKKK